LSEADLVIMKLQGIQVSLNGRRMLEVRVG